MDLVGFNARKTEKDPYYEITWGMSGYRAFKRTKGEAQQAFFYMLYLHRMELENEESSFTTADILARSDNALDTAEHNR